MIKHVNDGKKCSKEDLTGVQLLSLRKITLCKDWVNVIESCEKLKYFYIGDHCNWEKFSMSLERLVYLQRICMTVNVFNSKGGFSLSGHESSILENFMMNILSTDADTNTNTLENAYDGFINLTLNNCTNLESM
jgi:hypothetical protein